MTGPEIAAAVARAGVELRPRIVDLNVLRLEIATNIADFAAYSAFTRFAPEGTGSDYRLTCVDLDSDPRAEAILAPLADDTFRAARFRTGFYLTSYFGPPAHLITRGREFFAAGRQLERTVWTYFVKHILTIFSADTSTLHLKAAGFADPSGSATLLFGRGGAGKTVFLASACQAGMSFLTNTHVILDGHRASGIPSAIRVRDDASFGELIRAGGLAPHLEQGEFQANPTTLFAHSVDEATVRNLCVVDYRPDRPAGIHPIDPERCYDFLEQFAFAVSAYGLKDDLLAFCGGDFDRYTEIYAAMKERLRVLVTQCLLWRVNVDMLDPTARREVLDTLTAGARAGAARMES
ncbi:FomB family phosphonate monophosphate kinase [Streptosporangium sp. NPDC051022]|uniref:FomB family phosphonate monophosphate kinase n=1 Tax=Streptosporangium sp. NPDC051022 TaxID=3155752 RepID=UPI003413A0C9